MCNADGCECGEPHGPLCGCPHCDCSHQHQPPFCHKICLSGCSSHSSSSSSGSSSSYSTNGNSNTNDASDYENVSEPEETNQRDGQQGSRRNNLLYYFAGAAVAAAGIGALALRKRVRTRYRQRLVLLQQRLTFLFQTNRDKRRQQNLSTWKARRALLTATMRSWEQE